MSISAREAALKSLGSYRRDNNIKPIDFANNLSEKYKLSQRDKTLAVRLTRGVLQNMFLCDYYISEFSSIKLTKIEPKVLDVLRLSVYELLFMTKIPSNSTVCEGVSLVKKHSNVKAAGYSNAVLRKIAAAYESGDLPEIAPNCGSLSEILSIKYSHPKWLVDKFTDRFGFEETEVLLSFNNKSDRPIFAQINTLKTDYDSVTGF